MSWTRSLSVASTTSATLDTRRSEFDNSGSINNYNYDSRLGGGGGDFSDSALFHEFLSQRWANDLRVFSFSELKSATRGFSRSLLIGEGGFGCVFRGLVRVSDSKIEVAIKQLNRNDFQASPISSFYLFLHKDFFWVFVRFQVFCLFSVSYVLFFFLGCNVELRFFEQKWWAFSVLLKSVSIHRNRF